MEPSIYKPSIYKGAGIYNSGAEGGGGGDQPPEGYENLEYVEFTGNFNASPTSENEIEYNDEICGIYSIPYSKVSDYCGFFKTEGTGSFDRSFIFSLNSSNWTFGGTNGGYADYSNGVSYPLPFRLEWSNKANELKLNEYSKTITPQTTTAKRRITQLCDNFSFPVYFFSLKVIKDSDEIRRFIPLKRIADNVKGIYEIYSQIFFTGNIKQ